MTGQTCPVCGGNDSDAPCAYPSAGRPGCLRDARLARAWIDRIAPGVFLKVDPVWNDSTGDTRRKLAPVVEVLAVRRNAPCEASILVTVRDRGGRTVDLSAAWFTGIAP